MLLPYKKVGEAFAPIIKSGNKHLPGSGLEPGSFF